MTFDAKAEIEKIKATILSEEERSSRRAIVEAQLRTRPPKDKLGMIDIGPKGSIERGEGVMLNSVRWHDALRLATGWGARE